jgi:hypothetical protein
MKYLILLLALSGCDRASGFHYNDLVRATNGVYAGCAGLVKGEFRQDVEVDFSLGECSDIGVKPIYRRYVELVK